MAGQLTQATATRRQVVRGAVAGGAAALAASTVGAETAHVEDHRHTHVGSAGGAEPRPLPFANNPPIGNIEVHSFPPVRGVELVDITDFHGMLGVASVMGVGTETNLRTGEQRTGLPWHADLRFFDGQYIGKDHRVHRKTFSAI